MNTLARTLAAGSLLTAVAMFALFAAGVHMAETGASTMGIITVAIAMLTALPTMILAVTAIEAAQYGTVS
jgi:hypothetical protein